MVSTRCFMALLRAGTKSTDWFADPNVLCDVIKSGLENSDSLASGWKSLVVLSPDVNDMRSLSPSSTGGGALNLNASLCMYAYSPWFCWTKSVQTRVEMPTSESNVEVHSTSVSFNDCPCRLLVNCVRIQIWPSWAKKERTLLAIVALSYLFSDWVVSAFGPHL